MASAPQDTTTNPKLEELKNPWKALSLTTAQSQHQNDVALAKSMWDEVLQEFVTGQTPYRGKMQPRRVYPMETSNPTTLSNRFGFSTSQERFAT
jgi:hypothetical protein